MEWLSQNTSSDWLESHLPDSTVFTYSTVSNTEGTYVFTTSRRLAFTDLFLLKNQKVRYAQNDTSSLICISLFINGLWCFSSCKQTIFCDWLSAGNEVYSVCIFVIHFVLENRLLLLVTHGRCGPQLLWSLSPQLLSILVWVEIRCGDISLQSFSSSKILDLLVFSNHICQVNTLPFQMHLFKKGMGSKNKN